MVIIKMAGKTINQTPHFTDEKYLFNLFSRYNLIINCFDSIHDFLTGFEIPDQDRKWVVA
jgi:hypothetical protein